MTLSFAPLALVNHHAPRPSVSPRLFDGRYRVERELGRGAMGVVHRAHDTGLDRTVALKVIDPVIARDPRVLALFRREATALARVRSEHVVQVHSFGTHDGGPFFVMEYVEGSDLDAIIASYRQRGGVVPMHRAATILRQVASGLAAVHAFGIVHRDVKPSNVVLESGSGRPVLIDFGLAHPSASSEEVACAVGTPHYMAPEQWTGDSVATPASDVYAFGVLAYELLTGSTPYDAETVRDLMRLHTSAPIPRVSATRPSAAAFDVVIARALAKSPSERYADAGALGVALQRATRAALPDAPLAFDLSAPPSLLTGATIDALVIDDDETFRTFASRALELTGLSLPLRVRVTASGEGAIGLARASMPDLVVLDFDMPGLNGLETLSYLRALPHGNRARVLVVTGSVEKIGRCAFDLMGVTDFVAKPIAVRELGRVLGAMARRG